MILSRMIRFAFAVAFTVLLGPAVAAKVIHIDIEKLVFNPKSVAAEVGDTIEWTNHDVVAHTATADDKSWEVMLAPRATGSQVVESAGLISYFCRFHPNMRAEIEVTAP
jgi:plastocyanin